MTKVLIRRRKKMWRHTHMTVEAETGETQWQGKPSISGHVRSWEEGRLLPKVPGEQDSANTLTWTSSLQSHQRTTFCFRKLSDSVFCCGSLRKWPRSARLRVQHTWVEFHFSHAPSLCPGQDALPLRAYFSNCEMGRIMSAFQNC